MTFLSTYADMAVFAVMENGNGTPVMAGSNFQHVEPSYRSSSQQHVWASRQPSKHQDSYPGSPRPLSTIVAAGQEGIWARQSRSASELLAGLDKTLPRWVEGSGDRDELNLGRWSLESAAKSPRDTDKGAEGSPATGFDRTNGLLAEHWQRCFKKLSALAPRLGGGLGGDRGVAACDTDCVELCSGRPDGALLRRRRACTERCNYTAPRGGYLYILGVELRRRNVTAESAQHRPGTYIQYTAPFGSLWITVLACLRENLIHQTASRGE
ncbi:hypothetical protein B0T20DRAFT_171270 [Sordaria brevicollis]|uniref:Uncharacterized protein n=1 Tax=Sordaria brevicollis TaxID=83679 RepID=A0AAE0PH13_SORBR|nr:hypothetical protein B0T20DRAFT_171270 [Sordaria brevicollis]